MQGRRPTLHGRSSGHARSLALVSAMIISTAGCQGMAMTQESGLEETRAGDTDASEWPLKFFQHNFGAHCFDTIGCKIVYSGFVHGVDHDDEVSPPVSSYRASHEKLLSAGHIARRNFPAPAKVQWRSKDGVPHEAEVDIGEIFKDRVVLHNVPRDEIYGDLGDPDIILEVNDRTINVYMRAFVPTKTLQVPGNKYSGFRDDLILAWTKTY